MNAAAYCAMDWHRGIAWHMRHFALMAPCRYDPVSDRWTTVTPMGTPRYTLASAALMGSMICVGGFDGDKHVASSELYDPRMGRCGADVEVCAC